MKACKKFNLTETGVWGRSVDSVPSTVWSRLINLFLPDPHRALIWNQPLFLSPKEVVTRVRSFMIIEKEENLPINYFWQPRSFPICLPVSANSFVKYLHVNTDISLQNRRHCATLGSFDIFLPPPNPPKLFLQKYCRQRGGGGSPKKLKCGRGWLSYSL